MSIILPFRIIYSYFMYVQLHAWWPCEWGFERVCNTESATSIIHEVLRALSVYLLQLRFVMQGVCWQVNVRVERKETTWRAFSSSQSSVTVENVARILS